MRGGDAQKRQHIRCTDQAIPPQHEHKSSRAGSKSACSQLSNVVFRRDASGYIQHASKSNTKPQSQNVAEAPKDVTNVTGSEIEVIKKKKKKRKKKGKK